MSDRLIAVDPDKNFVLAENGPMRLIIRAWKDGEFNADVSAKAAEFSFICLEHVAEHQYILRQQNPVVPEGVTDPVTLKMVKSVRAMGDDDLTPMAAIAGSIADEVADWLFDKGMTRVIVDNGGDIAVRLSGNEMVKVGLRTGINSLSVARVMQLDAHCHSAWGVCTSGMGGRSLTRGIASAVTVLAETSSMADAAATSIANACIAEDDNIIQKEADKVDPYTDIPGIPVTVFLGKLNQETITLALNKALVKAEYFKEKGLICGALISAGGEIVTTADFNRFHGRL